VGNRKSYSTLSRRKEVELTSVCKLEEDQLKFVKDKFGFQICLY